MARKSKKEKAEGREKHRQMKRQQERRRKERKKIQLPKRVKKGKP